MLAVSIREYVSNQVKSLCKYSKNVYVLGLFCSAAVITVSPAAVEC